MGDSTLGYSIFEREMRNKEKAAHLRKFTEDKKGVRIFENSRTWLWQTVLRTWFGRRRYYDFVRYSKSQENKQEML